MKIIHFLPWYSPKNVGGTEKYILKLCKKQKTFGQNVCILCPSKDEDYERFTYEGIDVICLPLYSNFDSSNAYGIKPSDGINILKNYLNVEKPDILYIHCIWSPLI